MSPFTSPGTLIAALSQEQVLALTMWAEARSRYMPGRGWVSNPLEAMVDIGNIVVNRRQDPRWASRSLKAICLLPGQFSCWSPHGGADSNHDPQHLADNYEALLTRAEGLLRGDPPSDTLLRCLAVAHGISAQGIPDSLNGATHYYSPASMYPPGRVPAWAYPPAECTVERYGSKFYRKVA